MTPTALVLLCMSVAAIMIPALLSHQVATAATQQLPQVCGKVVSVTCSGTKIRTTRVNLGVDGEDTIFSVSILREHREHFKPSPEELYRATEVCATGGLELFRELPRMVVEQPASIAIRKRLKPAELWDGEHFFTCDQGVEMPVLVHEVKPSYTSEAIRLKKQGVVGLEALVKADGRIDQVHVTQSLDTISGLDAQAVSTVKKWRFKPGTRFGQPVPVVVSIEVTFTLTA